MGSPSRFSNVSEGRKQYRKVLTPSSDMISHLNLQYGENLVEFKVKSTFQGTQTLKGKIYMWDQTTKIIISDIDGTITKSDVLGQVLPMIGKDWSHQGVATLFTNIQKNGYEFVYLTARAIG